MQSRLEADNYLGSKSERGGRAAAAFLAESGDLAGGGAVHAPEIHPPLTRTKKRETRKETLRVFEIITGHAKNCVF